MKDYQKAELKMMQEVVRFFNENPDLEKDNKILKNHINKLKDFITEILKNAIKQEFDNTGYTENIKKLITEALQLLKRSLDNDMVHYKDTQPNLYAKYINVREIDDTQTTALSIKGNITDAETGKPLQHVRVTSRFKAGQDWKEMYATSTQKGNYQFKGIPDGKCTLVFELEFYDTITKEIVVYSDKATELNITIKRVIH